MQELGQDAATSKIRVYSVTDGGAWTNGAVGPYNGVSFNTRQVSGVAYIGGYGQGVTEKQFEVSVHAKAGTCEVLGTKVKFTSSSVLK